MLIILQWKLKDISLAHLHLLSPKSETLLFFFPPAGLKTSSLFCWSALARNIIHFPFFGSARWKTHFSFAGQSWPVGKIISHLPGRAAYGPLAKPGPMQTSSPYASGFMLKTYLDTRVNIFLTHFNEHTDDSKIIRAHEIIHVKKLITNAVL